MYRRLRRRMRTRTHAGGGGAEAAWRENNGLKRSAEGSQDEGEEEALVESHGGYGRGDVVEGASDVHGVCGAGGEAAGGGLVGASRSMSRSSSNINNRSGSSSTHIAAPQWLNSHDAPSIRPPSTSFPSSPVA